MLTRQNFLNLSRLTKLSSLALALFAASTVSGKAQIYNLTHGNSSASVDVGSSSGMFNWSLNGVDHLTQQWFWLGIGATPETAINNIGAFVPTLVSARDLRGVYANGQVSVEVSYLLTGTSATRSDISESVSIRNVSGGQLTFHFFQYSDFDLAGSPGGDTASMLFNPGPGWYQTADQWEGSIAFQESSLAPGANRAEIAYFPSIVAKLNDGNVDNLSNFTGPLAPGDVSWAFQWDFTLDNGDAFLITKGKYLQSTVVPEPSSLALISLGIITCALRRRSSK